MAAVGSVLTAFAVAALLLWQGPTLVDPTGSTVLRGSEVLMTAWVEVPGGGQGMWEWAATDYIDYAVEVV